MRVLVDDALFSAAHTVELVLLASCCQRPLGAPVHRLVASGTSVDGWLASQSPEIQTLWSTAVAAGLGIEATAPLAQEIVVHDGHDDWDAPTPKLSPQTTLAVLRRPLAIVCEDRVSDRRFITAIVPDTQRSWFDDLAEQSLITFHEVGSIDKFDRLLEYNRGEALRAFAVMDSDAMVAGFPSTSATRAVGYCQAARVRYHRLAWRFAESYLSAGALWQWRSRQPHLRRPELGRRITALDAVPPTVRQHFDMKLGDGQDQRRLPAEPPLVKASWNALRAVFDDDQRRLLADGFGTHVSDAFERDLGVPPGAEHEVAALFADIRSCL